MVRVKIHILFGVMLAVLSACGSLIDLEALQDETRLFTLRPDIQISQGPRIDQGLLVEEPVAVGAIDGLRIVVQVTPTEISFASTGSWESRPATLIHGLLVNGFESADRLSGITTTGSSLAGGYRLKSELRGFHVTFLPNGAATVTVSLKAALFAAGERFQRSGQMFQSVQDIPSRELEEIVSAFNRASREVIEEAVAWTFRSIDA